MCSNPYLVMKGFTRAGLDPVGLPFQSLFSLTKRLSGLPRHSQPLERALHLSPGQGLGITERECFCWAWGCSTEGSSVLHTVQHGGECRAPLGPGLPPGNLKHCQYRGWRCPGTEDGGGTLHHLALVSAALRRRSGSGSDHWLLSLERSTAPGLSCLPLHLPLIPIPGQGRGRLNPRCQSCRSVQDQNPSRESLLPIPRALGKAADQGLSPPSCPLIPRCPTGSGSTHSFNTPQVHSKR